MTSTGPRGPRRRRPWIIPAVVVLAVAIVIAYVVYVVASGQRLF
ncbi:hypothetical protein ACPEEZ_05925 [Frigoribacterium sp. 2-23]